MVWYNVNDSTANRSFSFNIGATSIGLNRLNAPDGLALQDRWQHVVAVMSGQGRKIYHNGLLVAESLVDNIVTIEEIILRLVVGMGVAIWISKALWMR